MLKMSVCKRPKCLNFKYNLLCLMLVLLFQTCTLDADMPKYLLATDDLTKKRRKRNRVLQINSDNLMSLCGAPNVAGPITCRETRS